MPKVFLSSTFLEMEEYRKAAAEAIDQYGYQCIRMETFPASDRAIPDFCRKKVEECDVFVLVIGQFYGTPIPGRDISYTEDEFDAAVALEKPRLVFVPAPKALTNLADALASMEANQLKYEEQKERQTKFKAKALAEILPRTFKDPADLKFQVGHSVAQHFIEASLQNPRVAPVKEPLINLPNTAKQILARDREAQELLEALRPDGPGIVSIAAPPGFGKSAVFTLALRKALPNREQAGLSGIAVLDAKSIAPGIASFAQLLGRITGLQEVAARFTSAAEHPDASLRTLFFDFLRRAGKIWLVVENAEAVLAPGAPAGVAGDFRDLLKGWCEADHQAKLLLLTRHAMHPAPGCHHRLSNVEQALLGGLPEDAALELLRQRLADTSFSATGEPLLRRIVQRFRGVPMAIEQFAGYLHWNEQGVELNQRFLDQNDLLRLHASEQMEDFLPRMIGETLKLLDAPSLGLLRMVAWANMPVPRSGVLALQPDSAASLTRLVQSNLMLVREGTPAEGRSFDMHPLVREALAEPSGAALDFSRIAQVCGNAGISEWEKGQFRPALSLYVLAERAARSVGEPDDLAVAIMNRGNALGNLGRLQEAVADYDESIAIYRVLVEGEHRQELRNDLAAAIMNRGITLWNMRRLEEAMAAYEESITIRRVLVEEEQRQELRNALAMAIMNRGTALSDLGRLQEAVAVYDESIAIRRVLVEGEHRQDLRNDLATAIMNRATALGGLGRLEEAVASYEESIAIYRMLVEGEHRQELRNDLALAIMNRGNALLELGRLKEAVAAHDESIAIYRVLVEGEHRQELRNDLALGLYNMAFVREKLGTVPAALDAAREARRLWENLVNEGMKHLEQSLADARKLETRLTQGSQGSRFGAGS